MSKVYDHFNGRQPTQSMMDQYIRERGGAIINTLKDHIFTDDTGVTLDTEETLVLEHPLCNGEFADRVEINPNFIVSITYYNPKSKIIVEN
jgi:hypothetical protein